MFLFLFMFFLCVLIVSLQDNVIAIIATVTCNMYNLMLLNFPNIMCKRFFLAMRLYLKKSLDFFFIDFVNNTM